MHKHFLSLKILLLILVGFTFSIAYLHAQPEKTLTIHDPDTAYQFSRSDYKKGERLFYGLLQDETGLKSCVSCHNIKPTEEFNWNPSAFEIAGLASKQSFGDFKTAIQNPTGKIMLQAHSGDTILTNKELLQLKGFLFEFYHDGGYKAKPVVNKLFIFIGLCILLILAFLDLVWIRLIKFRVIHSIVLLMVTVLLTKIIAEEAIALGRSKDYSPDQPIKFSHMVHAGQNKINCMYCHSGAEYSKTAGIPSMNVCLNCHMVVREGSRSGQFEINKIFAAVENKQPVKWVKVYNLPDHVFFSHAQHVTVGKLKCQVCHGPVEQMNRITEVRQLSMGWCVNCHRDTKVQFIDNKFYEKYKLIHEKLEKGEIDSVTVDMVGGTECMKCHY